MNFIKDNLILLAMPICFLVIFLIQKLEDESRAGSCCEVDKDEKPSASPHVIQKVIEVAGIDEDVIARVIDETLPIFGGKVPGAGGYCKASKDEEEGLNATELGILKVGINKMIVNCYADIQRQSLEELSDKLDRMIDESPES